jgi:hypothetical protein
MISKQLWKKEKQFYKNQHQTLYELGHFITANQLKNEVETQ